MTQVLHEVLQRLRQGARVVRGSPAFSALIVLTLTVGVGASGAVLSAIDRLALETPEGVQDPHTIWRLHQRVKPPLAPKPIVRDLFSYMEFETVRSVPGLRIGAYLPYRSAIEGGDKRHEVHVDFVEGDYFAATGVRTLHGRFFQPSELADGSRVAVISSRLWTALHGDADWLSGTTLRVNGHEFQVVGVTRGGFQGVGLNATHVWVPYRAPGNLILGLKTAHLPNHLALHALVRTEESADVRRAESELTYRLRALNVMSDSSATVQLAAIGDRIGARRDDTALPALSALAGAAGCIWLIAIINIATLVLLRTARRRHEVALQIALGISRSRLAIQVGAEAVVLALIAIPVAVVVTAWCAAILRNGLLPGTDWGGSPLNLRLVVAIAFSAVLGAFFAACMPAASMLRSPLWQSLRWGASAGAMGRTTRSILLGLQALIAVVMFSGAAVFVASLRNVLAIPTGYSGEDVVVAYLPPGERFEADDRIGERFTELKSVVSQVPEVHGAALSYEVPVIVLGMAQMFHHNGDSLPRVAGRSNVLSVISPEFLSVLGIRLVKGRAFSESDKRGTQPVILVGQKAARAFWPGEDPIGKCLIVFSRQGTCRTVVGVTDDIGTVNIFEPPSQRVFVPLAQAPGRIYSEPRALVVRTAPKKSAQVIAKLRHVLSTPVGGGLAWKLNLFQDLFASRLHSFRLNALLFSGLAVIAGLLASIGIYGATAYVVGEMTREIAVRRALGCGPRDLALLLVRRTGLPVVVGAAAGVALSSVAGSATSALLYGVTRADPNVIAQAAIGLVLLTALAWVIPFVRAARVGPAAALSET